MTTTIQLDPAALEAATTVAQDQWHLPDRYDTYAKNIVTAYLAAIESQVREAVVEVIKATGEVSDAAEGFAFNPTDEQAVQINEAQDNLDRTEAALFALLGMTETRPETIEN